MEKYNDLIQNLKLYQCRTKNSLMSLKLVQLNRQIRKRFLKTMKEQSGYMETTLRAPTYI
jgi:hypothetical protein